MEETPQPDGLPVDATATHAANLPRRDASTRVEEQYRQIVRDLNELREALTPYTATLERTQRPPHLRGENAYGWFSDYLGNALNHVRFSIEFGRGGALEPSLLASALGRLDARLDEFDELRTDLAVNHAQGHVPDAADAAIHGTLDRLEQHTRSMMDDMRRELHGPTTARGGR